MTEQINQIELPHIEVPKIKGHTKIELTDVNTGEVEVIEHDNTVTDGLAAWANSHGYGRASTFNGTSDLTNNRLAYELLGGIYLFDTTLPTTTKYAPANVRMVGNSYYGCAASSQPAELGSYNGLESHWGNDEIVLVYDWLTSQGNGTINCVCLGTRLGGRAGYGNYSGQRQSNSPVNWWAIDAWQNFQRDTTYTGLWYSSGNSNYGLRNSVLYYNNKIYALFHQNFNNDRSMYIPANISEVIIKTTACSYEKLDVFYPAHVAADFFNSAPETFNISIPTSDRLRYCKYAGIGHKTCFCICPRNDDYYDSSYHYWENGTTKDFVFVDVVSKTSSSFTILNTTGTRLQPQSIYFIDSTRAFVKGSSSSFLINYQTGETIRQLPANFIRDDACNYQHISYIAPDLFLYNGQTIYNLTTNAWLPINMASFDGGYYCFEYNPTLDALECRHQADYSSSPYNYFDVIQNPWRLMTVNNLPNPIVKTNSKTMKVTYTLTRI